MRLAIDFDGTIADTNRVKAAWILDKLGVVVEPWRCDRTSCVPIIGAAAYEEMSDHVYEREHARDLGGARSVHRAAPIISKGGTPRRHRETAWGAWNSPANGSSGTRCSTSSTNSIPRKTQGRRRSAGGSELRSSSTTTCVIWRLCAPGLRRVLLQDGFNDPTRSTGEVVVCRSWPEVVDALETGGFEDGMVDPDVRDGLTV